MLGDYAASDEAVGGIGEMLVPLTVDKIFEGIQITSRVAMTLLGSFSWIG